MREVTGPIIAIALCCAGLRSHRLHQRLDGQFTAIRADHRVSTSFRRSTPTLSRRCRTLRRRARAKDWLTALMDVLFALLSRFNYVFRTGSKDIAAARGILATIRRLLITVLLGATYFASTPFQRLHPTQDKQYLVSFAQLPTAPRRSHRSVIRKCRRLL